jgi:amidophosphoribosyltransferase
VTGPAVSSLTTTSTALMPTPAPMVSSVLEGSVSLIPRRSADGSSATPVYISPARHADAPHHECGLIGVSAPGEDVARMAFFGLYAQQHRGQEGAGIAVADGVTATVYKDVGLVSQVFDADNLGHLHGNNAIGHVRYSTTGSSTARNGQPFLVETQNGPLAIAHNGNLINASELRAEVLNRGYPLAASSDSEIILLMLAGANGSSWEEKLERTMMSWKGAYSLVILVDNRVIGVRDPWGFRPLSVGRLPGGGWAMASETCALRTLGCTEIEEVAAGEIVTLKGAEITRRRPLFTVPEEARCTFEFVYFSRPDSTWDDRSVHAVRQRLGQELAREWPVEADVVIAVPDSSTPAGIGYSRESGIPLNDGLIKNRYIGRTFIEPTARLRQQGVALKFNALPENLAGKHVVMIDDSIVRGTTMGPLVQLIRDAGALSVHVRITCPPIVHPCHMGVDMGTYDELISAQLDVDKLKVVIGADSLGFLSLEGMMKAIGRTEGYCNACFTGEYPIELGPRAGKSAFEGVLR